MFTVPAISRAPSFSGGETKTGPFPAETDLRGISRLPEALLALKSSWRASGLAVLRAPLGARTAHIVPFRAIAAGQRPKQGLSQLDQARHWRRSAVLRCWLQLAHWSAEPVARFIREPGRLPWARSIAKSARNLP